MNWKHALAALLLASSLTGMAQQHDSNAASDAKAPKSDAKPEAKPEDKPVVTHHSITLHGRTLEYTATAGRLPIRNDEGKVEAQMFFVAYTLDKPAGKRPLTFAFNGGPGSATIWLHMGALGPKRVKLLPNGAMPPPPFALEDNQDTWLDKSDLVFVDAINTGYSRTETPELAKKFLGVNGDIAAFGEFIRMYLQQNSRWTSPLYLAGESYGTTRAAGLSGYLIDHGIALNGIVLISTVMHLETVFFGGNNDVPYVLFLPTYATIAAYHKRLAPELQQNIPALQREAEHWATNDYALALEKGDALTGEERQQVLDHLSRYTGLSREYLSRANLRPDLSAFDSELLRDQGLLVGRLDGRFTGVAPDGNSQDPDYDPSEAGIRPPFTTVFGDYIRQELGYETDMRYHVLGEAVRSWDTDVEYPGGYPDTSVALRRALIKNPYLKVFIAEGIYDAATPYLAVEYTLNHMGLTPAQHANITRDQFPAGHMVYIDDASRARLKSDVDRFYDQTAPPAN